MAWLSRNDVDRFFSYQAPTHEGVERIRAIRAKAKELATLIVETTPGCADQSAAIRQLREVVMTASAAIVLEKGRVGDG